MRKISSKQINCHYKQEQLQHELKLLSEGPSKKIYLDSLRMSLLNNYICQKKNFHMEDLIGLELLSEMWYQITTAKVLKKQLVKSTIFWKRLQNLWVCNTREVTPELQLWQKDTFLSRISISRMRSTLAIMCLKWANSRT